VSTGVEVTQIERLLEREIARLASDGPTAAELARAQKGLFVGLASSLQLLNGGSGESGRAGVLQKLNHYLGDPGRLPAEMARVSAVSPETVRAAVALHLAPHRRLTVITVPQPATASEEGNVP
jgi:zinc protease